MAESKHLPSSFSGLSDISTSELTLPAESILIGPSEWEGVSGMGFFLARAVFLTRAVFLEAFLAATIFLLADLQLQKRREELDAGEASWEDGEVGNEREEECEVARSIRILVVSITDSLK